jgi:hypothetical protein
MGVVATVAVGAKQMGDPHITLPQYQVQAGLLALGTGLAQDAETLQVNGFASADETVNHGMGIELRQQQGLAGRTAAAAQQRVGRITRPDGKGRLTHTHISCWFVRAGSFLAGELQYSGFARACKPG